MLSLAAHILQHVIEGAPDLERTLYWRKQRGTNTWKGLREVDLKYVADVRSDGQKEYLFNLEADIAEKNDLKLAQPQDFHRLREKYHVWETRVRENRRGQSKSQ